MRAVAETLLERTAYANAHSAEVALRLRFKRRGWPLRTRAQAQTARRAPEGGTWAEPPERRGSPAAR